MSKWQGLLRLLPFCVVILIFTGLVACYIGFITIFDIQKENNNLFSFKVGPLISSPWLPEPRSNHWWMNRHAHYVKTTKHSNGSIHIIYFGDSITEGWADNGRSTFKSKYSPLGAVNYGISADRTEHLLWRIQNGEIEGLSPKLVILMIGVNNLPYYPNDEDIAHGIVTIVDYLRTTFAMLPLNNDTTTTTKILVLGILPRTGADAWRRIVDINQRIGKLDDGEIVFFLDMFNYFVSEQWGIVNEKLFYDGLHLTEAGYQLWADLMDPLFKQILNL